jgi:hypothetical protein
MTLPFYDKAIKSEFPNQKPFLICHYKNGEHADWDNYYLSKSVLIKDFGEFELRKIDFHTLLDRDTQLISQLSDLADQQSQPQVLRNTLDTIPSNTTRFGSGAFTVYQSGDALIWHIDGNTLRQDTLYELSFWAYNCGKNYGQDMTDWSIFVFETEGNTKTELGTVSAKNSPIIDECWSLCRLSFTPKNVQNDIEITFWGKVLSDPFVFDEFLIRPINTPVAKWLTDKDNHSILYYNNHFIKP